MGNFLNLFRQEERVVMVDASVQTDGFLFTIYNPDEFLDDYEDMALDAAPPPPGSHYTPSSVVGSVSTLPNPDLQIIYDSRRRKREVGLEKGG